MTPKELKESKQRAAYERGFKDGTNGESPSKGRLSVERSLIPHYERGYFDGLRNGQR